MTPKFKVGDRIRNLNFKEKCFEITAIGRCKYMVEDLNQEEYSISMEDADKKCEIAPKEVTITREKLAEACRLSGYLISEGRYFEALCKEIGL